MTETVRFEDHFERLSKASYRVAFRLLGDRAESEDVTQEALTRAYLRWDRIRGYEVAWVVRVSANLALDDHRRRNRTKRGGTEPASGPASVTAARIDLQRALARLPRRQREVVVLRYLADLSERDVSAVLGCSAGSVKTHASRGLRALRENLGEEYEVAFRA
jgi:RNA polymerase sigma-70 factor (sigma-E family)